MRILVVGSGGREHALVDKLRRDAPDARLYAAPGNPGIASLARTAPLAAEDLDGLVSFAQAERIDLTVVGPEAPLAAGIADRFAAAKLPLFGPVALAARLEASKAFAKLLMREEGVPTAEFEVFDDADRAREYVKARGGALVVKASGLAAGKGALVCRDTEEAVAAVDALMVERRFGTAGDEVVVEDFMEGVELSVFFLCDGERAVPLAPSRDYKRIGEGDRGANTGGMGAYAPAGDPRARTGSSGAREGAGVGEAAEESRGRRQDLVEEVRGTIAGPVLEGLARRGSPYRGFLYAGLMLTDEGPKVVEFNCRLGDPEAQAVLPITRAGLAEPMAAVARGESLGDWSPEAPEEAALITVLASGGYPRSYETDREVRIPEGLEGERLRVYHAGTTLRDGRLVTAGGRVLGAVGIGADLGAAARRSREAAEAIEFDGKVWRRDIGWHEGVTEIAPGGPAP